MNFLDKHKAFMQRQRDILGIKSLLTHSNGKTYEVQCSVNKIMADDINANLFQDKQSIKVTIMKNDLKDMKAPIKGYKQLTYNRVTYEVVDPSVVGGFDDAIILYGVVYGK